jgi:hypothetical protein
MRKVGLLFLTTFFVTVAVSQDIQKCNVFDENTISPIYEIILPGLSTDIDGIVFVDIWSEGFYIEGDELSKISGTGILSAINTNGKRIYYAGTFKKSIPIGSMRLYDDKGNCQEYNFIDGKIVGSIHVIKNVLLNDESIIKGSTFQGKLRWEVDKWVYTKSSSGSTLSNIENSSGISSLSSLPNSKTNDLNKENNSGTNLNLDTSVY